MIPKLPKIPLKPINPFPYVIPEPEPDPLYRPCQHKVLILQETTSFLNNLEPKKYRCSECNREFTVKQNTIKEY